MTEKQKYYQSAEYKLLWAKNNPEKVKESARKTYRKHKDKKADYQRLYRKNMSEERRPEYLKMRSRNQETRKNKRAEYVNNYKKNHPCVVCGEANPVCLDFHHRNPIEKVAPVASLVGRGRPFEMINAEIAKCVILCANCHRKFHAGEVII